MIKKILSIFILTLLLLSISGRPVAASISPELRNQLDEARNEIISWSESCIGAREHSALPFRTAELQKASLEGTASKVALDDITRVKTNECDVGDAVLFNGLICSSGEWFGCEAVKRAQGLDGRWWRSEQQVDIDKDGDPGIDPALQKNTFSGDHALGIMLYLIEAKNKGGEELAEARERATRWLSWMNLPNSSPSDKDIDAFCKDADDDKCRLYPWYLETMYQVWSYLGLAPHPLMKYMHNSIMEQPSTSEGKTTSYRRLIYGGQSGLSQPGFRSHLAALHQYIFKKLGLDDLNQITLWSPLKEGSRGNPFFLYIRDGATNQIAKLVLEHKKQVGSDNNKQDQWYLERDMRADEKGRYAYQDSMGWDFYTMINLLLDQPIVGNFQWNDKFYFADRGYFCQYGSREEYEHAGGKWDARMTIPDSIEIPLLFDGNCTNDVKLKDRTWRHKNEYAFLSFHTSLVKTIDGLVKNLTDSIASFQMILTDESGKLDRLNTWVLQNLDAALSSEATKGDIDVLVSAYKNQLGNEDTEVCRLGRESTKIFPKLRGGLATLDSRVSAYQASRSIADLKYFPRLNASYEQKKSSLNKLTEEVRSVLNQEINLIQAPKACSDFESLPVIYGLRVQGIDIGDTRKKLGTVSDALNAKIEEAKRDKEKDKKFIGSKRAMLSIEAELTKRISDGQINEAQSVAKIADTRIELLLQRVKDMNLFSVQEIEELISFGDNILAQIQKDSGEFLNFSAMPGLVFRRLENLRVKISNIDVAVADNPTLQLRWEKEIKSEIYKLLGTKQGQPTRVPAFPDEVSLLSYDVKLALIEEEIQAFETEIKKQ